MHGLMVRACCFLIVLSLCAGGAAASDQTVYEQAVRRTYARLAFKNLLGAYDRLLNDRGGPEENIDRAALAEQLQAARLSFVLSDFKAGPIQELLDSSVAWQDVVTKPAGWVLGVGLGGVTSMTGRYAGKNTSMAHAAWKLAPHLTENWTVRPRELLQSMESWERYDHYASYAVKVTFQGRVVAYKALFLFGTGADGRPLIFPMDHIVGTSAMADVLRSSDELGGFLALSERKPTTLRWFKKYAGSSCPTTEPICCDLSAVTCTFNGATHDDDAARAPGSARAVYTPAESGTACGQWDHNSPPSSDSEQSYAYHILGEHGASVTQQGTCEFSDPSNYSNPCNVNCSDTNFSPSVWDTGLTSNSCHVGNYGTGRTTSFGPSPQSCAAKFAAGIKSCFLCACNVSVSVSIPLLTVTFGGGEIWTHEAGHNFTCELEYAM